MAELELWGATVTVMAAAGAEIAAAAPARARRLEELQFVLGEGPTGEAFALGQPVLVPVLAAEAGRWVQFAAAAAAQGVAAAYALPLQLGGVRLGVLSAYAGRGRSLGPPQLAGALDLAEQARDVLLDSLDGQGPDLADGLARSVALRTEVYQAQGILMAAHDISLTEALVRLRALAYAEGVDLNELAMDLVAGRRPLPARDGDEG